jgi:ribonuclease Z
MNFAVTVLGSNSALPAHGRHPTSQVVTFHDQLYLIDCGEGTQMQMSEYKIRRSKVLYIFISHLHGDHYFGLIGLLNSFGLQNREQPLHIFAPAPLKGIIDLQLECANTRLPFALHFHALQPDQQGPILEKDDLTVEAFPTDHRIPCFGFLFREVHRRRKLNPERAMYYNIPPSYFNRLQEGEDYTNERGEKILNEWVTDDPLPGKRYAFCADTRYDERLLQYISGCDLIYHEATYLNDQANKAKSRYHSTGVQAATLASRAGAKRLLIGHFSSKYESILPFQEECRPIFPATELALEGATYIV